MTTVLVVEDETNLAEMLRFNLEREGYRVHTAADGDTGFALAHAVRPDLILLDIMLPARNGLDFLRDLRTESSVPVLLLTARTSELDRVQGLDLGADDYITKPFALAELLARVRAHLRRHRTAPEPPTPASIAFGACALDLDRRTLTHDGQPLSLRPKEYELLAFLAQHPGRAFSRDDLLNHVWDISFAGGSRTVDVHVRWLRRKIEPDPAAPRHLVTVRGAGYRFEL